MHLKKRSERNDGKCADRRFIVEENFGVVVCCSHGMDRFHMRIVFRLRQSSLRQTGCAMLSVRSQKAGIEESGCETFFRVGTSKTE